MPLKENRLTRSLEIARKSLGDWEQHLDQAGVDADNRRKNPRWRSLNADCLKIEKRIESLKDLNERGQKSADSESDEN